MCRITQEHPRVGSDFDYGGFTLCAGAFHLLHLSLPIPRRGPTTPGASSRFGLFRFRSPLLTESILFLFLRLLRCFTSPGIAFFSLSSLVQPCGRFQASGKVMQVLPCIGYPIRKSPGHSLCAAHRSLSQLVTSFFAF